MLQVPSRAPSSGPTLIRLLARLTNVEAPEPGQSLAAQLGQWLGWTDAVALSSALNGAAQPATSGTAAPGDDVARDCARVRAALTRAIDDNGPSASRSRAQARAQARVQPPADNDSAADYAIHRQRYLSLQQSMETAIAALRARLRTALSTRGPDMARLAAVDAVMERVLGAREQTLLIAVPSMLEAHFERLRQAGETAPDSGGPQAAAAWVRGFRDDMRAVLLAELDIRFQPVEGLLAALRAS